MTRHIQFHTNTVLLAAHGITVASPLTVLCIDERGTHQVVRTLFQHGHGDPSAAKCRAAGRLGEERAKAGQDDDASLELGELLGGEGRVHPPRVRAPGRRDKRTASSPAPTLAGQWLARLPDVGRW